MKICFILLINSLFASSVLAASLIANFDSEIEQNDQNLISDLNIQEMSAISETTADLNKDDQPATPTKSSENALTRADEIACVVNKNICDAFNRAMGGKKLKKAQKIIADISSIKLESGAANPSIFSIIANSPLKTHFIGGLKFPDYMEIFGPLIEGQHWNMAGGYFIALSLFDPSIQSSVMVQMLKRYPLLKAQLLIMAINFKLNENVILENLMNFEGNYFRFNDDEYKEGPIYRLPRVPEEQTKLMSIMRKSFMSFHRYSHLKHEWNLKKHKDVLLNFLDGMVNSHSLPEEKGALWTAFDNYSPRLVMNLFDLCPKKDQQMARYHLAHLIAKNPEKAVHYPPLADLVNLDFAFDRFVKGEADLIAIACLSTLPEEEQIVKAREFLSKTTIFSSKHLINSCPTSTDVSRNIGITRVPVNDIPSILGVAFKWNISDKIFAAFWKRCKRPIDSKIYAVRAEALRYESREDGALFQSKIEILKNL